MYFEPSFEGKDIKTCEEIASMYLMSDEYKNAQHIFDRIYRWAMEYGGGYIGARKAVDRFLVEYAVLDKKLNDMIRERL